MGGACARRPRATGGGALPLQRCPNPSSLLGFLLAVLAAGCCSLDFSYASNNFGVGLPVWGKNGEKWDL